jgi:hypothetical protein
MRVYVAALGIDSDPHTVDYECAAEGHELESVLYVPVPRGISARQLDSQLKKIQSQWLRAGQLIVLRLHPPSAAEMLGDELAIDLLRRRLEGLPVLAAHLGPDRSIQFTPMVNGSDAPAYDPGQLVDAVRFAELHSWLDRPGVVLPQNSDFYYEGPNGYRYQSFMRVGTAIQSMETLDAVSFWLQPHLEGCPIVVLDAWTINSLALNLSRYASHCGSPCGPIADIECLGSYDEDLAKLQLRLESAYRRLPEGTPALLVSSVVTHGNLHRRLASLIKEVGFEDIRSLALFGSAAFQETAFCHPDEGHYYGEDDPDCPPSGIPIAPSTYLVEVSIKSKPTKIREEHAEKAWDFFENYGGGDYLTVHREMSTEERHHMIHVDVKRLMEAPRFSKRLDEELRELAKMSPDVILASTHEAPAALAEEVSLRLGVDLIKADETMLPHLCESEKQKLREAKDILIVDDAVISGARLLGYRNFLRRCEFVTAERPSRIYLLAGLARVPNGRLIVGIEEMVDKRDRFRQVETLVLPDWGKTECPWCWELRQIEKVNHELPQTEKLEKRRQALRDRRGLKESLYMPWMAEGADTLPAPVWDLGPGSVFRAKSEIDLFVAVASAVQGMRGTPDLEERQMFPLAYVLDPASWLTGRYYDSVIPAAILRATRPHDIRATDLEPELVKGMAPRFANHDDLRGEMLLAMARRQLPIHPDVMSPEGLLSDEAADAGLAALMRSALEEPATPR